MPSMVTTVALVVRQFSTTVPPSSTARGSAVIDAVGGVMTVCVGGGGAMVCEPRSWGFLWQPVASERTAQASRSDAGRREK